MPLLFDSANDDGIVAHIKSGHFLFPNQVFPHISNPMRHPRILGDPSNSANYYHCMSRSIDERRVFESRTEKAHFRFLLRAYAEMTGIRVLTYCIMRNHFHLLLEVPHRNEEALRNLSDEALFARLKPIYTPKGLQILRKDFAFHKALGESAYRKFRAKFEARLLDLPTFMRELKQRYTQWYNMRIGRKGPLWDDRYKSVLVEAMREAKGGPAGSGALQTIAAYIDLNPVRAGIVDDPKSYRWSGYGEAIAGNLIAREGIAHTISETTDPFPTRTAWRDHAARYRLFMFEEGSRSGHSDGPEGDIPRAGKPRSRIPEARVETVRRQRGHLPSPTVLRCRIRYFADGLVIGSEKFVDAVFHRTQTKLGVKRQKGARRPRDIALGSLHSMRDLRGEVSG